MKITIRKKKCLICDRPILFFDEYKCNNCNNYYHKICLDDTNNIHRCIVCQKAIFEQTNWIFDITRHILCEILPCVVSTGAIIGIFIFFT